jgi:hypothetical protein
LPNRVGISLFPAILQAMNSQIGTDVTTPLGVDSVSRPARRRSRRWWVGAAAPLVALALLAGACSDSAVDDEVIADGPSGDGGTDGQTTSSTIDDEPDSPDPTDQSTDGDDSGTDDSGSDDSSDGSSGDGEPVEPFPGVCSVQNVPRQRFYAVDNIPADDPDGGLNLRTEASGGDVVATLPTETVVLAEDCLVTDDGGVWYAVATEDAAGWANAAYLNPNLPALVPTFGGADTEAAVVAVLDGLAAREWDDVADLLTLDEQIFAPFTAQLSDGGTPDLAASLAAYCATRICDAPYSVVEVRGSYLPERVSPEVDVQFTYSGGVVTQTFTRLEVDGEFAVADLPGRSILALAANPPATDELVQPFDEADEDLYTVAEQIRRALLSEDGPRVPADNLPDDGFVVSPDAFIFPEVARRQVITADALAAGSSQVRIWGYRDGVGTPIVDTVDGFMADYRRSLALLEPDVVGIDTRVGLGNTIDNLAATFPDARIVEFHRRGRGEAQDFNWSSVRMALELQGDEWKLVGLTSDSWTI